MTSDAHRRARSLRRVHMAAIIVPTLVIVVACLVIARNVMSAGDDRRALSDIQRELVDLRHTLQTENARYWQLYAFGGSAEPSAAIQRVFIEGQAEFNALAARREHVAAEAPAIRQVRVALASMAEVMLRPLDPGQPDALLIRQQQGRQAVTRLDVALTQWVNALDRGLNESSADADAAIARLLIALGLLVSVLVAAATMMWAQIDRQRRRVLDDIATERDASRLVMDSVQDGLMEVDDLGRVRWVNGRMCTLIGRDEGDLIGEHPPWARDLPVGFTGDTDLIVRHADGPDRDILLTVSRLAGDRGFLHVGRDMTLRRRAEAELRALSVEREVLREVATFVAGGPEPEEVFALVARESARLLGADAAVVRKFVDDHERAVDMGTWIRPGDGRSGPPRRVRLSSDASFAQLLRTGTSSRVDDTETLDRETADLYEDAGYRTNIVVPIRVGDEHWGVLEVLSGTPGSIPPDAETQLARFAELVGMTVSNADTAARLADQAATDPLTGLANHRRFHERLRTQAAAARETGGDLAVVMIDLDRFSDVNATFGHQVGDEVLAETARRLAREARVGETVARIGGEEFSWILPNTDGLNAWRAAERARRAIASIPFADGVGTVTASAGVADLAQASDTDELRRLADGALYWAKASGRNLTLRYSPEVVRELSVSERAERLARSQAVTALRALARAVDAKDPSTARHAERVATLSVAIAREMGWGDERLELIEEAALLHDVGKIGVPDALLFKADYLTLEERKSVEAHAALGAEIVSDILSAEQVAWIRAHHERWDGTGYPDSLAGDAIPDGAQIISVADAWDAMTSVRTYGGSRPWNDAREEILANQASQFAPEVVDVFIEMQRRMDEQSADEALVDAGPGDGTSDDDVG